MNAVTTTSNLRKLRAVEAFLMGAGSVWCINPLITQPAVIHIERMSDSEAIASDWRAVGLDLLSAMQEVYWPANEDPR